MIIKKHYKQLFGAAKYVVECEAGLRHESQHPYAPVYEWMIANRIWMGWAYNWMKYDSSGFSFYFRTQEDQMSFLLRWG